MWKIANVNASNFKLNNGMLVAIMLLVLCVVTSALNPAFLSLATVFDTLRNLTVIGILGMGVLLVMLSGGIDVSFPAVAALTSYVTVKLFVVLGIDGPVIAIYGLAVVLGIVLGLINGAFVSYFKLPALIVTLGTSSLFYGFNLFFIGSQNLFNIPKSLGAFSRTSVFVIADERGRTFALHPVVLMFLAIVLLVALFLRYTTIGRGIYALGGSRESAQRVGLPVRRIELLTFAVAGALAAVAGMTQVVFFRNANPGALSGSELDVIAAVVLGGISVTGGKGSVGGAMIGLTFVVVMTSSLVLLGIPAAWQKVFVGAALIVGISSAAWQVRRKQIRSPIPASRMENDNAV
jgi:simple sugar transport system permease protein